MSGVTPASGTRNVPAQVLPPRSFISTVMLSIAHTVYKISEGFFYLLNCCSTPKKPHTVQATPPPTTPQIPQVINAALPSTTTPAPAPITPAVPRTPQAVPAPVVLTPQQQRWNELIANTPLSSHGGTVNLAGIGPVFATCPTLGYQSACIPRIGKYIAGNTDMAVEKLVVRLPKAQLNAFPEAIRNRFQNIPEDQLDLFFIVQSDAYFTAPNEPIYRNVMFHTSAYPDILPGQTRHQHVPMGVFAPHEIAERPLNREDIRNHMGEPIQFNGFGPVEVHIHPQGSGMALSPNNGYFNITQAPMSSFFSAAELPTGRRMAAFHILVHNEQCPQGALLEQALAQPNLRGMWTVLQTRNFTPAIQQQVNALFEFQFN